MFPPKKKAPAIGVMIGLGDKGDSGPSMPPKYKSGGGGDAGGPGDSPMQKPPAPARSASNQAQEAPGMEQGEDHGQVAATPESVNYSTEAETCQHCEYMQGTDCTFLKMPVSGGDHCGRFEAKSQDQMPGGDQEEMGEGGMPGGSGY